MFHIIFNPVAGKKKSEKNLSIVERIFRERKIAYEVRESHAIRDAQKITKELTENGAQDIIALGGDGTLHEVLNGIVDPTTCRLGLIPSGTGNDFAETIGISEDAEKAAYRILDGEAKEVNYLEVGGVRCMNVAGLGMDVDVLERCQKGKLKGKIKYLMSLIQSLFAFKGYKIEVESEHYVQEHDALLAAACNGTQFGGGIRICPLAKPDDDKISVVIVDCIGGKMKIIKAFIQLMKGKILEYPAAHHFLCDRVKFTPALPCPVQLDGELYNNLHFDVKLCKGLKFYQ